MVEVRGNAMGFAQEIDAGPHRLFADEPLAAGGTDVGPDPYALLLAALGACTSMTLSVYARRHDWALDEVVVRLTHAKVHAEDGQNVESNHSMLDLIEREILLRGKLVDDQRAKLMQIADRCPVYRTLTSEIRIETRLVPVA
jgi:putative redox protein